MSFLQFIHREIRVSLVKLVLTSGALGLSHVAIVVAINGAMTAVSAGKNPSLWAIALFLVSFLLFRKAMLYVAITSAAEIEAIIHRIRVRLMDLVSRSELIALERIGRSNIITEITSNTSALTQAATTICFGVESVVIVCFMTIYVAYLSLVAFALTGVIVCVAAALFHVRNRRLAPQAQMAAQQEHLLVDCINDFLEGFKEVRLNSARSDALFNDAGMLSRSAAHIKIRSQTEIFKQMVTSQASLFVLLGAVVFLAPQLSQDPDRSSITQTTIALLFIFGNCFDLLQSLPTLLSANAAADRLTRLELDLSESLRTTEAHDMAGSDRFRSVGLHNIVFRYFDRFSDLTFQIGPLDFVLRSGDLVFITGGNGSGKSTFLKVLAGLYPPDSGDFVLDGMRIDDNTRENYRALMSAIFTDFHLFRRLYGIPESRQIEVSGLLTRFGLYDKTALDKGEFRTLDLSGGQRKRLALVVGLLEKRPILLLDEWAADQDPEFRRKFYHELLPELIEAGMTVVVVTHDDRYLAELQYPARRLHMDEGRFIEQHSMEIAP